MLCIEIFLLQYNATTCRLMQRKILRSAAMRNQSEISNGPAVELHECDRVATSAEDERLYAQRYNVFVYLSSFAILLQFFNFQGSLHAFMLLIYYINQ